MRQTKSPNLPSNPPWSERRIARALCHDIFGRRFLMLVNKCHWTGSECDVLAVTPDHKVVDIEIKISRQDLRIDAKKEKWYHRYNWKLDGPQVKKAPGAEARRRREWPNKCWKHYIVVPESVWNDDLYEVVSPKSGVILLSYAATGKTKGSVVAREIRKAEPNRDAKAIDPDDVRDIARLATLRMWNAYDEVDRARDAAHDQALLADHAAKKLPAADRQARLAGATLDQREAFEIHWRQICIDHDDIPPTYSLDESTGNYRNYTTQAAFSLFMVASKLAAAGIIKAPAVKAVSRKTPARAPASRKKAKAPGDSIVIEMDGDPSDVMFAPRLPAPDQAGVVR